jgi:hypothetical protein
MAAWLSAEMQCSYSASTCFGIVEAAAAIGSMKAGGIWHRRGRSYYQHSIWLANGVATMAA